MPSETNLSKFPLGRRFGVLTRLYYGALTKKLEHLDIERHFFILILLHTTEKECSQQYISDVTKKDKATMVRIVNYLTEKGYIKRVSNPNDRREYHLNLTAKAKKVMPEILSAVAELNKVAMRGLAAKQLENFYICLDSISANLGDQPAHKVIMNFKKAK